MKTRFIFASLLFFCCSCDEDQKLIMKIEATMGVPFVASAPAEVSFKENGFKLYIESYSNYRTGGVVMPTTTVNIKYANGTYEIAKTATCDSCTGEVLLEGNLKLIYEKIIKETCVRSLGGGNCEFKIDSAQFLLKTGA